MRTALNPVEPFWMRGLTSGTRPQLDGNHETDVVIVGAGLTGLWAAHYLTDLAPGLRVTVVEAAHVGAGASGRNGGWLSHLVPGNRAIYAEHSGHAPVVRLQRLMVEAVDEVLAEANRLAIDIDAVRGGNLVAATTRAQWQRLKDRRTADLAFGLTEDECQLLDARAAAERVNVHGLVGALFYPTVARIQPAKLVTGLAVAVERKGVTIFEHSPVDVVAPGRVTTASGRVRANSVLVCSEGFSGPLLGRRRAIPINSSMIVTNRLTAGDWEQLGWQGRECFSDAAHTFVYAQRTADDRIAIGGRGSPYRWASGTNPAGATPERTVSELVGRLHRYFPDLDVEAETSWSGVLGVTRDWCATVEHHPSGLGAAFGYAGHGVSSANLAARTLVDLTLRRDTELAGTPMVAHRSPSWEPEPRRWLGVHSMYHLFRFADAWEDRRNSSRTSLIARAGARLAGLQA